MTELALDLSTGRLTAEQLDLILTHLPCELTFGDEHDKVVYYSQAKHMVFSRSPAAIGRTLLECHSPRSRPAVARILEALRNGRRDVVETWFETKGHFMHVRYFAVRDADGRYRGVLEVAQDVTAIRGLSGENRSLDW
jgi:PAS domain S-box-containing protein